MESLRFSQLIGAWHEICIGASFIRRRGLYAMKPKILTHTKQDDYWWNHTKGASSFWIRIRKMWPLWRSWSLYYRTQSRNAGPYSGCLGLLLGMQYGMLFYSLLYGQLPGCRSSLLFMQTASSSLQEDIIHSTIKLTTFMQLGGSI